MWAPHSPVSSRSSAKNVDLRAAVDEYTVDAKVIPQNAEMWMTNFHRSRTPSMQSSVPSLSGQSSSSAGASAATAGALLDEEDSESQRAKSPIWPMPPADSAQVRQSEIPHQLQDAGLYIRDVDLPLRYEFSGGIEAKAGLVHAEDDSFPVLVEQELKTPKVSQHQAVNPESPAETVFSRQHLPEDDEGERGLSKSSSFATTVVDGGGDDDNQNVPLIEPTTKRIPGPLEAQLLGILSKVAHLESNQPTVMASDYAELQDRVAELEAKNASLQTRHEALFALRDEDVANVIKTRVLLADERREHEAMRKLRDDDLKNVLELREKLARATWSQPSPSRQVLEKQRSSSTASKRQSLSQQNNVDLWQAAKTAAMEHRVLELESANSDLRAQLERAHSALLQVNNRNDNNNNDGYNTQSHVASSETAENLTQTGANMGALFESALRHRERYITRIEKLKSENDRLRGELDRKEDEMASLEHVIEKLRLGFAVRL